MHARVMTIQVQSGKIDELLRVFREAVLPAGQQQQGFKGGLLLTDHADSRVLTISLWATAADLRASEAGSYFREAMGKFEGIFAAPPTVEHYEVSLQV